jgi:nitrite reductase/ring-hydroxylating ferredoxin subunit
MACSRRSLLQLSLSGALAAGPACAMNFGATDWPKLGDRLVRADHLQSILHDTDIIAGAPPILAFPLDAATGKPRTALFSQILLLRLNTPETTAILAYSAVCKHAGCIVSAWVADRQLLLCPCHGSEYDPAHAGAVVTGPADAPLPTIPIALHDSELVIAGAFSSHPGGETGRTD